MSRCLEGMNANLMMRRLSPVIHVSGWSDMMTVVLHPQTHGALFSLSHKPLASPSSSYPHPHPHTHPHPYTAHRNTPPHNITDNHQSISPWPPVPSTSTTRLSLFHPIISSHPASSESIPLTFLNNPPPTSHHPTPPPTPSNRTTTAASTPTSRGATPNASAPTSRPPNLERLTTVRKIYLSAAAKINAVPAAVPSAFPASGRRHW
ncbi:uncharacterized protein BDZ99DRAFT_214497 [Mytilinidion resinicola]|uniref:Uncharacterized protein n=1 Tax=Mytilinidion resinicola TaxID=574789 RepID=A0A6A6Y1G7_9PEZI|nr:uncharacterized protein BDZ99DRAFT_214497 [Mytilinidion resinicola]KAF2801854.1 hypothetical protein BDZ99DRAFT_214497 [Mytilinidion resinicola]